MRKKNKSMEWLIIASLAVVAASVWLSINAIQAARKSTLSEDIKIAIKPLNAPLDMKTIDYLTERQNQK
jgi:hypothetical protein